MTPAPASTVKCLVWDLDDTLWDGVVLEGDRPGPFPAAVRTLRTLDRRGILHAVASRGDHATAAAHLAEHDLAGLFCALEIGWGAKSDAIRRIGAELNLGLDTIAFVDNDAAELAEVASVLPMVRRYRADQVGGLHALREFQPAHVTEESANRRYYYRAEQRRVRAGHEFAGSSAQFLASLDLAMTLDRATEDDLARVHELTLRTHQLNTTGRTFDLAALRALCAADDHEVLVAGLTDRFGSYGTIGVAVVAHSGRDTVLELLLMSCRVLSRGVGAALLHHIVGDALARGRRPVARFVPTPVNRIMMVTLRFAGFEPIERTEEQVLLALPEDRPSVSPPGHVRVVDRRHP
ncbi:HAD-IIIC family phosphatase [Solihabitans fulvus]|uniref:HAD-IIIC family phosphatase n=1 Tax=Solihabitans fulvus TaxID=1892852 RepID=A0A5B2XTQ3_9PSEU|nr:HAD-IIIC family phosphatase [Solihabitans fulvus]KAA2266545.1 HAD-IIIC family phosphatase [Solihabitans fulvus]